MTEKPVTLDSLLGTQTANWVRSYGMSIRAGAVARKLGITTPQARRLLDKCVKHGVLVPSERYSYVNCRAWVLPSTAHPDTLQDGGK